MIVPPGGSALTVTLLPLTDAVPPVVTTFEDAIPCGTLTVMPLSVADPEDESCRELHAPPAHPALPFGPGLLTKRIRTVRPAHGAMSMEPDCHPPAKMSCSQAIAPLISTLNVIGSERLPRAKSAIPAANESCAPPVGIGRLY